MAAVNISDFICFAVLCPEYPVPSDVLVLVHPGYSTINGTRFATAGTQLYFRCGRHFRGVYIGPGGAICERNETWSITSPGDDTTPNCQESKNSF